MASKSDKSRKTPSSKSMTEATISDSAQSLVAELISQGVIQVTPMTEERFPRIYWKTEPNPLKGLVQRFEILTGGNGVHRFWIGPNPDNTQECIIGADQPSASLSVDALVSAHFNQREVSLKIAYLYANENRIGTTTRPRIDSVSVQ